MGGGPETQLQHTHTSTGLVTVTFSWNKACCGALPAPGTVTTAMEAAWDVFPTMLMFRVNAMF
jgi:hypothetical protein